MKAIAPAAWRGHLQRAATERPGAVVYDAERELLLDLFSGKVLPVDWLQDRELGFILGNVAARADEWDDKLRAFLD